MSFDQLQSGLSALDPLRRAILETAALPGVTAAAIAERFGWSIESVNHEIRRGMLEVGQGSFLRPD